MSETPAYLGVERSVSGQRWELRAADERDALAFSQRLGVPDIVGRVLSSRGFSLEEAEGFLNPSLKEGMPDPSHLKDMDKAVDRIVHAIRSGEAVAVFGDYDVDGATSSALLKRFFDAIGADLRVYIPDRMTEGYGPNLPALMALKAQGAGVVITVDCGITAFEVLEGAKHEGVEVIVVDHHASEPRLPDAVAVVNPNRLDDDSPHGTLAAVGVTFLLIVALNRALRKVGYYASRKEPDLLQFLDIVALGTVCDVVPLVGLNRAFVRQGLKVMAQRRNIGISALSDIAGMDSAPEAYHLGFLLGPRINAGGRVGEAGLGARLLSIGDRQEAQAIALRLDAFNAERKEIEQACLQEAIAMVESGAGQDDSLVYVSSDGWHPGIIGIVAGRLRERYNRPACVVSLDGEGIGKGSGRSIGGVDLGAAVIAARQAEMLINGGGHKMAAGFTVSRDRQEEFRSYLSERIAKQVGAGGIVPRLSLDGAVRVEGASVSLFNSLQKLAPFGVGNSEPRFAIPDVRIMQSDVVGSDHVRCRLAGIGGGSLKAIAFRVADQPLGDLLLGSKGDRPIHVAGKLKLDRWQGREQVQIIIDDAAPASS